MKTIGITDIFYKKNEITADLIEYYYHYNFTDIMLIDLEISNISSFEYLLATSKNQDKHNEMEIIKIELIDLNNYEAEYLSDFITKGDFPEGIVKSYRITFN